MTDRLIEGGHPDRMQLRSPRGVREVVIESVNHRNGFEMSMPSRSKAPHRVLQSPTACGGRWESARPFVVGADPAAPVPSQPSLSAIPRHRALRQQLPLCRRDEEHWEYRFLYSEARRRKRLRAWCAGRGGHELDFLRAAVGDGASLHERPRAWMEAWGAVIISRDDPRRGRRGPSRSAAWAGATRWLAA